MKHLLKHLLLELLLLVIVVRGEHEAGHNIYRDWEDYGAVVLCRNAIQGLKIPQLINCKSYCWQDLETQENYNNSIAATGALTHHL